MTYDHIENLYQSDPTLFLPYKIDPNWQDEWDIVRVDSLDTDVLVDEDLLKRSSQVDDYSDSTLSHADVIKFPEFIKKTHHVSYWPQTPDQEINADNLGFHLPFHHSRNFHGIYIMLEGYIEFAIRLRQMCSKLPISIYFDTAKFFIYYHEAYHHKVEMFATRLETILRKPIFRTSVFEYYQRGRNTDDWPEEMLANVHAYESTIDRLKRKRKYSQKMISKIAEVLLEQIRNQGPGYRKAADILMINKGKQEVIDQAQNAFWASLYRECLPNSPVYEDSVWQVGYFDYPLNKVNGRLNFLIPKGSLLSKRMSMAPAFEVLLKGV